jgi:hypothetical protein
MKPVLTFVLHFVIATLIVPGLALISGGLLYFFMRQITSSATGPQRFYSDYLFLLIAANGLWLAYVVCDAFNSRSAVWVWIPALLAFAVRVAIWRSTGSVLFHSSVAEHFFTADCQIQNWRNADFTSCCGDKLFLMQLVIGPFGYSAGAAIQRIVERKRRSSVVFS